MLQCGDIDDVYSYEKMKNQPDNASPDSARLSSRRTTSFRVSGPPSPTSAKLGGGRKTASFRWMCRQGEGAVDESAMLNSRRTMSFSVSAQPPSTSAKLSGKKTGSFRWLRRQGEGAVESSKRAQVDTKQQDGSTPKKTKDHHPKRIGLIDILIGYHSLLQASPTSSFLPLGFSYPTY